MPARPLVKEGSTGPDVIDAILRLNLAGADPQLSPTEPFDDRHAAATRSFQASHGVAVDGQIGDDTWALLDQLAGDRLVGAADVAAIAAARNEARALLLAGDFAGAKALLDPFYADPRVPPELRSTIAANLGWAEHGLGDLERARALYAEQLAILLLHRGVPLAARDTLQRLRELNLGLAPGPLQSELNRQNLPPNG